MTAFSFCLPPFAFRLAVEVAVACFERLLGLANDVGLLSEEYEPVLGRMLGNFPQALTHVGLVNSAIELSGGGGPAINRV